MNIFVVVPIYNEEYRAVETVNKILLVDKEIKIILVNDGSSDDSLKILKKSFVKNKRVIIANHVVNLGKGAAMKTGVKIAWKLGGTAIVFIDADGQHNPKYLPKFTKELEKYPIVFGYRLLNKKSPWIRRNGNKFAKLLIEKILILKEKICCVVFWDLEKRFIKK